MVGMPYSLSVSAAGDGPHGRDLGESEADRPALLAEESEAREVAGLEAVEDGGRREPEELAKFGRGQEALGH